MTATDLARSLGYGADDVLLIVNCDDFGMCHAANLAAFEGLESGVLTSATLMVPCPWVPEALRWWAAHPDADIGIHLTHTAEWRGYRWGPVADRGRVPGLLDPDGYFWPDNGIDGVYGHATVEEGYIEARAQIEAVLTQGLTPTHLDTHMGVLEYHDQWWQIALRLAREYDLPMRQASDETYARFGVHGRREATSAAGVVAPTLMMDWGVREPEEVLEGYTRRLRELRPGVWEVFVHASLPGDELSAITGSAAMRAAEYRWATAPETRRALEEAGIHLIGYRPLRELQRSRTREGIG